MTKSEADEEDFEEEDHNTAEEVEEVEVEEEDFKEEDAENSENIVELLEQTAAEAPLTEETAEETDTIAAQDDTNAQPAHTESESAPVILSTVAAPIIDLALSEEPSAEIAEEKCSCCVRNFRGSPGNTGRTGAFPRACAPIRTDSRSLARTFGRKDRNASANHRNNCTPAARSISLPS